MQAKTAGKKPATLSKGPGAQQPQVSLVDQLLNEVKTGRVQRRMTQSSSLKQRNPNFKLQQAMRDLTKPKLGRVASKFRVLEVDLISVLSLINPSPVTHATESMHAYCVRRSTFHTGVCSLCNIIMKYWNLLLPFHDQLSFCPFPFLSWSVSVDSMLGLQNYSWCVVKKILKCFEVEEFCVLTLSSFSLLVCMPVIKSPYSKVCGVFCAFVSCSYR